MRREREISKLEHLTDQLLIALNVDPGAWRATVAERDQLREDFEEALAHQGELTDRIYLLERAVCPHCGEAVYPREPAPPSKSDPDYDRAMTDAAAEDASRESQTKKEGK